MAMENNKTKYKWLKKQDYLENLTIFSKICYALGIIRFKHQSFGGGYYTGKFRFVLCNPLTWVLVVLMFVFLLFASLYDALRSSILHVKGIITECIVVELDRDYESKE